jgi:predicted 2-oxoglutarate/Fe(II)-dependent dioxygenase YbiX
MEDLVTEGIVRFPDFFTAEECASRVSESVRIGYAAATITTSGGLVRNEEVRNNSRVILDDDELAKALWNRLRTQIPAFLDGRQAVGVNERFRYYRYEPNQSFSGHVDGVFRRSNGEESRLTLMIYLNEDFVGGETAFPASVVKPRAGMAIIFRHDLFHEGRPVKQGTKYVLRSDIMFNPVGRLSG